MEFRAVQNCYDFFNCKQEDKEICPAYIEKAGDRCWEVASQNTDIVNSDAEIDLETGSKKCHTCSFHRLKNFAS